MHPPRGPKCRFFANRQRGGALSFLGNCFSFLYTQQENVWRNFLSVCKLEYVQQFYIKLQCIGYYRCFVMGLYTQQKKVHQPIRIWSVVKYSSFSLSFCSVSHSVFCSFSFSFCYFSCCLWINIIMHPPQGPWLHQYFQGSFQFSVYLAGKWHNFLSVCKLESNQQ